MCALDICLSEKVYKKPPPKVPIIFALLSYRKNFIRAKKRVRINHEKRAIDVRVIELKCSNQRSSLRKHAYSNILKILPPRNENFQIKNSDIFHISAQNIDCVYSLEPPQRGGSNEYPQPMFLSRKKRNNVYPCKPQFYCIKVGFKGVIII